MVQLRQYILNSDLVQSQICSWRAKNVTGQKIKFPLCILLKKFLIKNFFLRSLFDGERIRLYGTSWTSGLTQFGRSTFS